MAASHTITFHVTETADALSVTTSESGGGLNTHPADIFLMIAELALENALAHEEDQTCSTARAARAMRSVLANARVCRDVARSPLPN